MAKDVGLHVATKMISRGRPSEKAPGTLFVPADEAERDFLLGHDVIRPATDEEIALHEKVEKSKAKGGAKAAAEPKPADDGKADELVG